MLFKFRQHTRLQVYELWRDAVSLMLALDPVPPETYRTRRAQFLDGVVHLSRSEALEAIERGALWHATHELVRCAERKRMIPNPLFTAALRQAERPLKSVAISPVR